MSGEELEYNLVVRLVNSKQYGVFLHKWLVTKPGITFSELEGY